MTSLRHRGDKMRLSAGFSSIATADRLSSRFVRVGKGEHLLKSSVEIGTLHLKRVVDRVIFGNATRG